MLLLLNAYDGIQRCVLDDPLAGHLFPDLVAANMVGLRPLDWGILERRTGWGVGTAGPERLRAGVDVLLIDADVWFPRRAFEQLLRDVGSSGLPVKVMLARPSIAGGPASSDVAALFLPASVASSLLSEISDGVLQCGVGAAGERLGEALLLDGRGLDSDDPPTRVTGLADLAMIERRILLQRAFAALKSGVRIRDPHQVAIRGELHCGADVQIDLHVIIEGRVTLGDGVHVGAHSTLIDSTIGARTRIEPYSMVERAQIGRHGVVGPYGRVRPGTVTGDAVQIGNFVEIKNAEIGSGSRINHLAFVGDATVGNDVTLGAGTITCNHNRHGAVRVQIGDGAYVGSGTELVGPLVVGENATIGAGSTITEDVPPDQLTLARERQVSVPGWRPPDPPPTRR